MNNLKIEMTNLDFNLNDSNLEDFVIVSLNINGYKFEITQCRDSLDWDLVHGEGEMSIDQQRENRDSLCDELGDDRGFAIAQAIDDYLQANVVFP